MLFHYDNISIKSERSVMTIDVYLGALAGLRDLLTEIILFFFGGYFSFISQLKCIQYLFCVNINNAQIKKNLKQESLVNKKGTINFDKLNKAVYFIKKMTCLKFFNTS